MDQESLGYYRDRSETRKLQISVQALYSYIYS